MITPEQLSEICEKIVDGLTVREICDFMNLNYFSTLKELTNEHLELYDEARKLRTESQFDELSAVAKDEAIPVQRARLQIDTVLNTAAKVNHERFGDKSKDKTQPIKLYLDMAPRQADPKKLID